jgi:hypothetical protein
VDWAEDHHDVCVMAEDGTVLGKRRVLDSVAGIGELHSLVAELVADDDDVVIVGIEVDRGLLVGSLVSAGYEVYAVNPMASARYRDRHAVSGAKSDPGDAKVLADLVRTDRHNHRPVAGDSDLAEGVKLLARAHQSAIWGRQRQLNALRSALREYYPGAIAASSSSSSPRSDPSPGRSIPPRRRPRRGETTAAVMAWNSMVASMPAVFPGRVMYLPVGASVDPDGRFSAWLPPLSDPHAPVQDWVRVRTIDDVHFCPAGAARDANALLVDLTSMFALPVPTTTWSTGAWTKDPVYVSNPTISDLCPDDHPTG